MLSCWILVCCGTLSSLNTGFPKLYHAHFTDNQRLFEQGLDSEPMSEAGKTRVVVYSTSNDALFSDVLIDIQLVLKSSVAQNDRSIIVESVQFADDGAGFVNTVLVPNASFAGPDSSVVYRMGDMVSASSIAYGTNTPVDRVEFLVDGASVSVDSEPPYEMEFPLQYFGNITIFARAYDQEGNWFTSDSDSYMVNFPTSLEAWLNVFFTSGEQLDPTVGALSADLDLDGGATLLEYAMGLHPRRSDSPRNSSFILNPFTGSYEFGFIRPVGVTGVSYQLQVSEDLDQWDNTTGFIDVVPIDSFWEEVRFSMLELNTPREFGRVLIKKEDP